MGCCGSTANVSSDPPVITITESVSPGPVTAAAPTPPVPLVSEDSSTTLIRPRSQTPPPQGPTEHRPTPTNPGENESLCGRE